MLYSTHANRYPGPPTSTHRTPVVQAPVGLTVVTYENPPGHPHRQLSGSRRSRPATGDWLTTVHVNARDHGGHFSLENPAAGYALRRTFHAAGPEVETIARLPQQ